MKAILHTIHQDIQRRRLSEEKERDNALTDKKYQTAASKEMVAVGLLIAEKIVEDYKKGLKCALNVE